MRAWTPFVLLGFGVLKKVNGSERLLGTSCSAVRLFLGRSPAMFAHSSGSPPPIGFRCRVWVPRPVSRGDVFEPRTQERSPEPRTLVTVPVTKSKTPGSGSLKVFLLYFFWVGGSPLLPPAIARSRSRTLPPDLSQWTPQLTASSRAQLSPAAASGSGPEQASGSESADSSCGSEPTGKSEPVDSSCGSVPIDSSCRGFWWTCHGSKSPPRVFRLTRLGSKFPLRVSRQIRLQFQCLPEGPQFLLTGVIHPFPEDPPHLFVGPSPASQQVSSLSPAGYSSSKSPASLSFSPASHSPTSPG